MGRMLRADVRFLSADAPGLNSYAVSRRKNVKRKALKRMVTERTMEKQGENESIVQPQTNKKTEIKNNTHTRQQQV